MSWRSRIRSRERVDVKTLAQRRRGRQTYAEVFLLIVNGDCRDGGRHISHLVPSDVEITWDETDSNCVQPNRPGSAEPHDAGTEENHRLPRSARGLTCPDDFVSLQINREELH